jgi:hypothetical protein
MPDRIQQEVEELLAKLDKFPPKRPLSSRIRRAIRRPFAAIGDVFAGIRLPSINAGHVLLAAVIVLVVAYVAGGSGGLWTWLIAGAILAFIGAFVWSLRRHSRPSTPRYWRDRPLDLNDRGSRKNRRDRR